jgi:penicillin amidase
MESTSLWRKGLARIQLVGVKKEKFTIKDVYNIYGYMSFSFAMAQKNGPAID